MRPEWRDHIRQMVEGWPPVSDETYTQLARLLSPERPVAVPTPLPSKAPAQRAAA